MQQSKFKQEYNAFMEEMDNHYKGYPTEVSRQEQILWNRLEEKPDATAMEKKRWVYDVIAKECDIKLFRHCPFYFEVVTGRERNSVGAAYPPKPGIDSWVMRSDTTGFYENFQNWVKPYMDDDIIDSTMYMDCAHHGMGVKTVLKRGFIGIKEEAEQELKKAGTEKEKEFLTSVISAQEALIHLTKRFSCEAESMLQNEGNPEVRKRLQRIKEAAEKSPIYPAETFYEALNTIWYLREIGNSFEAIGFAILGHIDLLLEPYYERDIKAGILSKEEAKELITWFVALTDARWDLNDTPYGTNTSLNIGGCDSSGAPVFNDITRFVLEAYLEYRFVNPKLQARFSSGASEEYYQLVSELAASGTNVLSIFNDEVIIKGKVEKGKAIEDARLYVSGGCQETVLAETEFGSRAYCYLNPTKYFLMMISPEKYDFFDKEHICPYALTECRDFAEFYDRVLNNMTLIVNAITWHYNKFEQKWKDYNPCPLFSSTISDCIKARKDVSEGGARYNGNAYAVSGIGTFIDSLYAVKYAVFDTHKLNWQQLVELLETNFEGEEEKRLWLQNQIAKYGEDNDEVNELTRKTYDTFASLLSGMTNTRGGQYEAALWSFYGYEWLKEHTGATPDGRKAGESLTRGINPAERVDTTILQMVHSLNGVDLSRYPGTAVFYFEMPLTLAEQDRNVFEYLIKYFIKSGGNVFDFDVVDAKAIEDAMIHPEKHQNLVVRVCGYSARFVTLESEMQKEIANRAKRMT